MLSSKQFEERLQIDNFQELEKESQNTKIFFENLKDKIKCDEVDLKFPAFCLGEKEIRVKYPTYKIRIINNKMSYKELKELLEGIDNYEIYEETNVVEYLSLNLVQSTAIHCLGANLDMNTLTAEKIEKRLHRQNIRTQRCVDSMHISIPIDVDEEGYIKVLKYKDY